jgi:hypothetical protein
MLKFVDLLAFIALEHPCGLAAQVTDSRTVPTGVPICSMRLSVFSEISLQARRSPAYTLPSFASRQTPSPNP